jgi:ATP-dependent Clp protease adaptor protein ClpS
VTAARPVEEQTRYVSVVFMTGGARQSRGDVPEAAAQPTSANATLLERSLRAALENPAIEQETETRDELDLPWQVVVHNDPVNLMSYVTMVFQKVFGFTRERAEKHMLEVHREGRSVVWSGVRERAELYVQQLHGYLLLATIERVK